MLQLQFVSVNNAHQCKQKNNNNNNKKKTKKQKTEVAGLSDNTW